MAKGYSILSTIICYRWYWWETSPADGYKWTPGRVVRSWCRLLLYAAYSGVRIQFVRNGWSTSHPNALRDAQCLSQLLSTTRGEIHHRSDVLALGIRFSHVGMYLEEEDRVPKLGYWCFRLLIAGCIANHGCYRYFWTRDLAGSNLRSQTMCDVWSRLVRVGFAHQSSNYCVQHLQVRLAGDEFSEILELWRFYLCRSYRDKTGKMRPFREAVRPLVPLFSLAIVSTIWAFFSPNSIVNLEPRMFIVLSGTVFSNINVSIHALKSYEIWSAPAKIECLSIAIITH